MLELSSAAGLVLQGLRSNLLVWLVPSTVPASALDLLLPVFFWTFVWCRWLCLAPIPV